MLFGTNVNVDFWCNEISQPDQGKGLNNWMLNSKYSSSSYESISTFEAKVHIFFPH